MEYILINSADIDHRNYGQFVPPKEANGLSTAACYMQVLI